MNNTRSLRPDMAPLGVLEIFYGHPWSASDRQSYAQFLAEIGFQFYIYGPKADSRLRKDWQKALTSEDFKAYQALREPFARRNLQFGMILSPHGLDGGMSSEQKQALTDKVKQLNDLGLDFFGLFFDDMKSAPDLANRQLEILQVVQKATRAKIIFCPSFYCNDSLLDMMFGERPPGYLEMLGAGVDAAVEILWTGEQIISEEISAQHLLDVNKLLRRAPFICDNFYADDGPVNCRFLRTLPFSGRSSEVFSKATHWGINPMNQASLSKLTLLAVAEMTKHNLSATEAFAKAVRTMARPATAEFLFTHAQQFAKQGLEAIPECDRVKMREQLSREKGPLEQEVIQWLDGYYAIDFLAMLEQSCYVG